MADPSWTCTVPVVPPATEQLRTRAEVRRLLHCLCRAPYVVNRRYAAARCLTRLARTSRSSDIKTDVAAFQRENPRDVPSSPSQHRIIRATRGPSASRVTAPRSRCRLDPVRWRCAPYYCSWLSSVRACVRPRRAPGATPSSTYSFARRVALCGVDTPAVLCRSPFVLSRRMIREVLFRLHPVAGPGTRGRPTHDGGPGTRRGMRKESAP
jgi:hypothetical protein